MPHSVIADIEVSSSTFTEVAVWAEKSMSETSRTEVDALLAEAEALATDVAGARAGRPQPSRAAESANKPALLTNLAPEIRRILSLEVPVIVQLAERAMFMSEVLELNVGSVIEFEKRFDAELSLIVTNRCIGLGHAVKVGENFGLRVTRIGTIYDKIRALGT
jgi:flagellar motor switch protein FliN/FliY